ncbi:hypothetical protein, partial [Bacillus cereus]
MVRLKLVYFLLPLILFIGGCGNTVEETKYEKQFLTQVKAISKTVDKMSEIQKKDQSLSSTQAEYKETVMELKEVVKGFKDFKGLVPDGIYEYRHKELVKAMDEYELSISKLLKGMSDTKGNEWIEGINQFNKATDTFVVAAGKSVEMSEASEQGKDVAIKDTPTQPTEQKAEVEVAAAEPEPAVEQSQQQLTVDEVKEIFENYVGVNDKLNDVSVENGEIKATIVLAPDNLFPAKDMAVNRYSQLSDELLNHEGWQTLTVTYANIGSISMNRNE